MAIQTINLTVPGGDTPRSANTKINANFSDQANAASRIVGKGLNNLVEMKLEGGGAVKTPTVDGTGWGGTQGEVFTSTDVGITDDYIRRNIPKVSRVFYTAIPRTAIASKTLRYSPSLQLSAGGTNALLCLGTSGSGITVQTWNDAFGDVSEYVVYTNLNTTKDSNGFLKGASPIIKVHADKVVLNEEAEQQIVTFKKNGIGDYTITTESGLSTDGWYIELPKDMNGNPKVAIGTLDDKDGVITLKTYKRMFSMETFTFEPDLESPLDIPDGRWIDLRLNELPKEPPVVPTQDTSADAPAQTNNP